MQQHTRETSGSIDVQQWLKDAKPINDDTVFHHGYVPFKAHYDPSIRKTGREAMRMRSGHIVDILASEFVELQGFGRDNGRAGFVQEFLAGTKSGPDDDLSISWTSPGEYMPLIFVALEDVGTTGNESIAFYKNDEHLATYSLGNRNSLPYVYPYDAERAREADDIPMATRLERAKLIGVLLRRRCKFSEGDKLRIVAEAAGSYNIAAVMLVPRTETMKISDHEILHPTVKVWQAGRQPMGRQGTLQFAWVTRMPSRSILLWNTNLADLEAGRGNLVDISAYAENHQYYAAFEPVENRSIYYRILAESNDGRRIASSIMAYTHKPLPAQKASGRIELHPIDSVDAIAMPAYASAPLSEGELFDLNSVRLVSLADNRPAAAQFRAVGHHQDGSVRWLGADFSAQPETGYALEYGPKVRSAGTGLIARLFRTADDGLHVGQQGDDFTVSSKLIKADFSLGAPAGLAGLQVLSSSGTLYFTPANMRLYMTGPDGRRFTAGMPTSMYMEHSGPQHVTVRCEGHFLASDGEPLMHYIVRWQMYKDAPGLGMELTVGNDRDEDKYASFPPEGAQTSDFYRHDQPLNWYFVNIRDLYLELDMPDAGNVSVGLDGAGALQDMGRKRLRLFQRDENTLIDESDTTSVARFIEVPDGRSTIIVEETDKSTEARLDGRLLWQGKDHSVGIKFDRFWQQYPKSYEFADRTLRIGIMPAYSEEYYPMHRLDQETATLARYSDTGRLFFYLRQGMYRFMYGVQKTHQLSLFFDNSGESHLAAERVMPPTALFMPRPDYNCSTFAVGDFLCIKADDGTYPAINAWMSNLHEVYVAGRGYGLLNFGDVWGERIRHWQNLQVDFAQSASKEFWRTGQRQWLALAYEAAMHFADVDTVNYGRNRGCQAVHAPCHTGGEYLRQEGIQILGYPHSLPTNHMSIKGIRNIALISGSGRMIESVEQFAEFISGSAASFLKHPMGNRGYNVQNTFMSYELESNPFDLNAARIAFHRMVTDLDPYNPEYSTLPHGYKEITGDPRVDFVMKARVSSLGSSYTPHWDENLKLYFRGLRSPGRGIYTAPTGAGAEAYMLTGEPKYREMFAESTAYGLAAPRGNWGPSSQQAVQFLGERSGLISLPLSSLTYYLDAAGITEIEPLELPTETVEVLEAWGESRRLHK